MWSVYDFFNIERISGNWNGANEHNKILLLGLNGKHLHLRITTAEPQVQYGLYTRK